MKGKDVVGPEVGVLDEAGHGGWWAVGDAQVGVGGAFGVHVFAFDVVAGFEVGEPAVGALEVEGSETGR